MDYWRSPEELTSPENFQDPAADEFPVRTPDWQEPAARRTFLKVMGASIAMAASSACTRQPPEVIVPYVRQPEEFIPGKPLFYASAMTTAGIARGVLVESHLGRPTKIEGNPLHPDSLGATDAFMQASILDLYDPDRSRVLLHDGNISGWGDALTALTQVRDQAAQKKGAGLRILTGTVTSPTLGAQLQQFLTANPDARWHQYEACGRHSSRAGSLLAFGRSVNAIYRLERADVILSLDADFLCSTMPGGLRYAREFAARRRGAAENPQARPPRLYIAEGTRTVTGGMADHRFRMKTGAVADFARAVEAELRAPAPGTSSSAAAVARDLSAARGTSLVIAGDYQPAAVHALAHAMNQMLGNVGSTVVYTDSLEVSPVDEIASLRELIRDMQSGAVESLLILGGNPVYDTPADLDFLSALKRVKTRFHLGLFFSETAAWCHWHIPEAHYLESWSDGRAFDGTVSIVQPLIMPLYGGKSRHELVGALAGQPDASSYDLVRSHWRTGRDPAGFDSFWQTALHDGIVAGTAFAPLSNVTAQAPPAATPSAGGLEINFRPDPAVFDGTFANNSWLQEMPKPQNKMTWDNSIWISPVTASRSGINTADVVTINYGGRTVEGPVWVMPGHADDSITIHLGYGRTRAGQVGNHVGFNAFAVQMSNNPWLGSGASLSPVGRTHQFATTQHTQTMEERDPFRLATYTHAAAHPEFARPEEKHVPDSLSMFPAYEYNGYKWGMAIDLNSCTGCQACTIACQSENNIPVVGKEEVIRGRHMNWLRVDRYYHGNLDNPDMYFQPVPCMHCEQAPCELVCPVAATVHSGDGLNQMIYNRCVGTRYCSNNCPYKVRRFNFLLYADWETPSLFSLRNPDVTVRSRGVMEKCTYCVQRINSAKIESEKEDRKIREGEIVTACQQACPSQAIIFGDLNDPNNRVTQLQRQQRSYGLLEELNTHPRTRYLARLRNPNPDLEKG